MSQQYYISLGAGPHQLPLIKAAKKAGYGVISVDQNIEAVGHQYADFIVEESILNYRKIYYKLSIALLDGVVIGGFSASYGSALTSWAYLAEIYKVHGPNRTIIETLLDKYTVRKKLKSQKQIHKLYKHLQFKALAGTPSARELKELNYPVIVKSRSGYGKHNIFEADEQPELKKLLSARNLKSLRLTHKELIIEEKIEGDEITVCGLIQDFHYHLVSISDKVTDSNPPFIEKKHLFPSKHQDLHEILHAIHQKITEVFQISDCPLVSEWKISKGMIYLVELSPQIPGEYLGSHLIPESVNYNYFANLVRLTTGKKIQLPPPLYKSKPGEVNFYLTPEEYQNRKPPTKRLKEIFSEVLNPEPLSPPESNKDRYGVAVYTEY